MRRRRISHVTVTAPGPGRMVAAAFKVNWPCGIAPADATILRLFIPRGTSRDQLSRGTRVPPPCGSARPPEPVAAVVESGDLRPPLLVVARSEISPVWLVVSGLRGEPAKGCDFPVAVEARRGVQSNLSEVCAGSRATRSARALAHVRRVKWSASSWHQPAGGRPLLP